MVWTWASLDKYIGDTKFYTNAIARGGGKILEEELATSMDYVQATNRGAQLRDKTLQGCTGVLKKMCQLLKNVIKKIKKLSKDPKLAVQVYNDLNFIRYSSSGNIDKDIKHIWKRQTIRNDPKMLDTFLSQLDEFLKIQEDLTKELPTRLLPARYISKGEEKRLCKQAKNYMLHTYKTSEKIKFSGCDETYNKKTKEMMDYYKNNKKILEGRWDEPLSYNPELLKEMKAWVKKQNKLIQDEKRAERLKRRQSSRLKF